MNFKYFSPCAVTVLKNADSNTFNSVSDGSIQITCAAATASTTTTATNTTTTTVVPTTVVQLNTTTAQPTNMVCLSASSITLSCAASQLIKVEEVFVARTAVAGKLLY